MKRILYLPISLSMRFFGFRGYSATLALNALKKDISNRNIPWSIKLWAWKRGFTGTRVHTYEIDESNYRNHIPDFDYYKLHPINGKYSNWIDDKLTMKYILAPFNEFLPRYYFQIENGEILKLMDCPSEIKPDIDGIISLLKREGNIALKLLSGSLGAGFYRLTHEDNAYYVNTKETSLNDLKTLISSLEGYLVTEYIIAHEEIRKIYDVTPNTLRVQVVRDKNKKPKVIGSFMRFGTKKSGVLEITAAGTIFSGVDINNGTIFDASRLICSKLEGLKIHPDTNESMEIVLPHWEEIKQKILEISNYISNLSYMGFDIIITDNGFKIIEINSLSALTFLPYYFPFFENNYSREFFIRKFKERPKKFKRVLKMLDNEKL